MSDPICRAIADRLRSAQPERPTPADLHAMEHGGYHVPPHFSSDPERQEWEHNQMWDEHRRLHEDAMGRVDKSVAAEVAELMSRPFTAEEIAQASPEALKLLEERVRGDVEDQRFPLAGNVCLGEAHSDLEHTTAPAKNEPGYYGRSPAMDALSDMKAAREFHLTTDSEARKEVPLFSGCIAYFPDALAAVAHLSKVGNDKHNPGEPLHWSRGKSDDHEDCILRHIVDRGTIDTDGVRHSAKVAWRALAMLQLEIEAARARGEPE